MCVCVVGCDFSSFLRIVDLISTFFYVLFIAPSIWFTRQMAARSGQIKRERGAEPQDLCSSL